MKDNEVADRLEDMRSYSGYILDKDKLDELIEDLK